MKRKTPIHKGYLEQVQTLPKVEEGQLRIERVVLLEQNISNLNDIRLVCDTVRFKNCVITDNVLEHVEFIDCIFEDTMFNNNRFTHSTFVRCEFKRTKLDGSHIIDSMMEHTLVQDCSATYFDVANSTIKVLEIKDTLLHESSWFENKLKDIVFQGVSLQKSDFYKTPLQGIDLSTTNIEGVKIDISGIKGAIIAKEQAELLCSLLGVTIKE